MLKYHVPTLIEINDDHTPLAARVNCPCPEQGRNPNRQLSSAKSAPILPTESEGCDQTVHRVPLNGLMVILGFYE